MTVHITKFDSIKSSDQILFVSMMKIWNLRYSRHFLIFKCVGLELMIFVINLNIASFFKVFRTFDCVFL